MSSAAVDIEKNIDGITARVARAANEAGRNPNGVKIIAMSKTRSAAEIASAHAAGLQHFGENYLQDAQPKVEALSHLPITWHFVGQLQANKTRAVAAHFDWVHTVDRARIARRLNDQRERQTPLEVLIQVNVDADPAKAGLDAREIPAIEDLMAEIATLPALRLRGLMTILSQETPPAEGFRTLAELAAQVAPPDADAWDGLSMGMSADFVDAIHQGATLIRIGTAIFGPRPSPEQH